jgi:arylsulfatase A-like enzyme
MYDKSVKWGGFDDTLADKPYIQRQQVRNWNNESRTWDDWEPIVRKYYAQITELDYHIGKIIETLKDQGKYENTTIIFTADHGDMCGNHKMFDKHYVLYEDVIHVPLIIKPAQGLCEHRVGRTREYTMHNLELGPTLMELHGISPSGMGLHGISFTGVLSGGRSARNEAVSTLNGAQFGLFTQRCIKTDRWKYIWNPTDTDELYDLTVDPWEVDNRINDPECRDSVAFLRKQLLEILCREGDPFCVIGRGWAARKHLEENRKI